MNRRYRVTKETPYGDVTVGWTDDLNEALRLAAKHPNGGVYDQGNHIWVKF